MLIYYLQFDKTGDNVFRKIFIIMCFSFFYIVYGHESSPEASQSRVSAEGEWPSLEKCIIRRPQRVADKGHSVPIERAIERKVESITSCYHCNFKRKKISDVFNEFSAFSDTRMHDVLRAKALSFIGSRLGSLEQPLDNEMPKLGVKFIALWKFLMKIENPELFGLRERLNSIFRPHIKRDLCDIRSTLTRFSDELLVKETTRLVEAVCDRYEEQFSGIVDFEELAVASLYPKSDCVCCAIIKKRLIAGLKNVTAR